MGLFLVLFSKIKPVTVCDRFYLKDKFTKEHVEQRVKNLLDEFLSGDISGYSKKYKTLLNQLRLECQNDEDFFTRINTFLDENPGLVPRVERRNKQGVKTYLSAAIRMGDVLLLAQTFKDHGQGIRRSKDFYTRYTQQSIEDSVNKARILSPLQEFSDSYPQEIEPIHIPILTMLVEHLGTTLHSGNGEYRRELNPELIKKALSDKHTDVLDCFLSQRSPDDPEIKFPIFFIDKSRAKSRVSDYSLGDADLEFATRMIGYGVDYTDLMIDCLDRIMERPRRKDQKTVEVLIEAGAVPKKSLGTVVVSKETLKTLEPKLLFRLFDHKYQRSRLPKHRDVRKKPLAINKLVENARTGGSGVYFAQLLLDCTDALDGHERGFTNRAAKLLQDVFSEMDESSSEKTSTVGLQRLLLGSVLTGMGVPNSDGVSDEELLAFKNLKIPNFFNPKSLNKALESVSGFPKLRALVLKIGLDNFQQQRFEGHNAGKYTEIYSREILSFMNHRDLLIAEFIGGRAADQLSGELSYENLAKQNQEVELVRMAQQNETNALYDQKPPANVPQDDSRLPQADAVAATKTDTGWFPWRRATAPPVPIASVVISSDDVELETKNE